MTSFSRALECLLIISATVSALPSNVFPLHHRQSQASRHGFANGTLLTSTQFGSVVDVEITFGNQSFLVEVDLGSSDLWVVRDGWECIDGTTNLIMPQENCTYAPDKSYTVSNTFRQIQVSHSRPRYLIELMKQDQYFGVYYGAGIASGLLGHETVAIAGVTVPEQVIGVVNKASNAGDGFNSGLMGLAFPAITSAHPGTLVDNSTFLYNRVPYDPLGFHMANCGLIKPFFSLGIERTAFDDATGPGGYLGLGEIVPVSHKTDWTRTPVVPLPQIPVAVAGNKTAYWALQVKSVTYGPGGCSSGDIQSRSALDTNSTSFNAILDNGNPTTFLPSAVAEAINTHFSPPAEQTADSGYQWTVDCNATAPSFGVEIGTQIFWHDPRDMIYNLGDGTCASSIARAEDVSLQGVVANFLGMQFFKNVLAVFDFGINEMRFAAREQ